MANLREQLAAVHKEKQEVKQSLCQTESDLEAANHQKQIKSNALELALKAKEALLDEKGRL